MAYYSAPEIAHVRLDVCDTCHTYLKSIDLTKTGLPVVVVDELATIPLDLWAREHGYEKLQINLLEPDQTLGEVRWRKENVDHSPLSRRRIRRELSLEWCTQAEDST